jgi:hypothetical protein
MHLQCIEYLLDMMETSAKELRSILGKTSITPLTFKRPFEPRTPGTSYSDGIILWTHVTVLQTKMHIPCDKRRLPRTVCASDLLWLTRSRHASGQRSPPRRRSGFAPREVTRLFESGLTLHLNTNDGFSSAIQLGGRSGVKYRRVIVTRAGGPDPLLFLGWSIGVEALVFFTGMFVANVL